MHISVNISRTNDSNDRPNKEEFLVSGLCSEVGHCSGYLFTGFTGFIVAGGRLLGRWLGTCVGRPRCILQFTHTSLLIKPSGDNYYTGLILFDPAVQLTLCGTVDWQMMMQSNLSEETTSCSICVHFKEVK